jgi:hypothetical protein
MPKITLTDFVDIVSKSGTPKATKVAQVKNRAAYDPRQDFYRAARERIVETHQKGQDKAFLRRVLVGLTDPKKITSYPEIIKGYTRWWGRKSLSWFTPPSDLFAVHGVDVSVNPELGLEINGDRHIIKLYFKDDALTKTKSDIVTHLMETCLRPRIKGVATTSTSGVRG